MVTIFQTGIFLKSHKMSGILVFILLNNICGSITALSFHLCNEMI